MQIFNPQTLSATRKLAELIGQYPEAKNFAAGLPDPNHLLADQERMLQKHPEAVKYVLENTSPAHFNYGKTAGPDFYRDFFSKTIATDWNLRATAENTLIGTAGNTGWIDILLRIMGENHTQPSAVFLSNPTYTGYLATLDKFPQITAFGVNCDKNGMIVEDLANQVEKAKRAGFVPRAILDTTRHHNPTGRNLTLERWQSLYEILKRDGIYFINDNAYSYLSFDNNDFHPLNHDPENLGFEMVTFSKILIPGLRCAVLHTQAEYLTPDNQRRFFTEKVIEYLAINNLNPSIPAFMCALSLMIDDTGTPQPTLKPLAVPKIESYKKRYQMISQALSDKLGSALKNGALQYDPVQGGFFIYLRYDNNKIFPNEVARQLLEKYNVAVVPTEDFWVKDERNKKLNPQAIRLSFSGIPIETIEPGVDALAKGLKVILGL